jgi:hypothetical protein
MEKIICHIDELIPKDSPGLEYSFTNPWIFWNQRLKEKTALKYSFFPVCKYSTIAGFWTLMNNLNIKEGDRIFFMREGIRPLWEDPVHKNGAHLIITLNKDQDCRNIFLNCLLGLVGETFCNDEYESLKITGLTYINEPTLKQLRIWTTDENIPIVASMISDTYLKFFENAKVDLSKQLLFLSFKFFKDKKLQANKKYSKNKSDSHPNPHQNYIRKGSGHYEYVAKNMNEKNMNEKNMDRKNILDQKLHPAEN